MGWGGWEGGGVGGGWGGWEGVGWEGVGWLGGSGVGGGGGWETGGGLYPPIGMFGVAMSLRSASHRHYGRFSNIQSHIGSSTDPRLLYLAEWLCTPLPLQTLPSNACTQLAIYLTHPFNGSRSYNF